MTNTLSPFTVWCSTASAYKEDSLTVDKGTVLFMQKLIEKLPLLWFVVHTNPTLFQFHSILSQFHSASSPFHPTPFILPYSFPFSFHSTSFSFHLILIPQEKEQKYSLRLEDMKVRDIEGGRFSIGKKHIFGLFYTTGK